MDQLNVSSELPLVEAAVRWAAAHNLGAPLNPSTSRRLLGPCLQQLRFLALSAHVAAAGHFSPEEALQILVNLTTPDHMQLPEHVSHLKSPRCQPD